MTSLRVLDPDSYVDEDKEEKFWLLIVGSPIKGLSFYGPFGEKENALNFADEHIAAEVDWWAAELEDTSSLVKTH